MSQRSLYLQKIVSQSFSANSKSHAVSKKLEDTEMACLSSWMSGKETSAKKLYFHKKKNWWKITIIDDSSSYLSAIILLNFIFTGLHGHQITPSLSTNKQRHRLLLLKTGIPVAPTHLWVILRFGNIHRDKKIKSIRMLEGTLRKFMR